MKITEREWLARTFENMLAPHLAEPDMIDKSLVLDAYAYFEARVLEGSDAAGKVAYDATISGADPERPARDAMAKVLERAVMDTAAALRDGKI